jgi:transporter family-2 protein
MEPLVTAAIPLALAAATVAGLALAAQAPINAALAQLVGGPLWATVISFAVGLTLLAAVAAMRGPVPAMGGLANAPWWVWLGGALGALYVFSATTAAPALGALTLVAAVILGQLLGALALDAWGAFGLPVREIGPARIAAVALVAAGLILSRF